MTDHIIRKNPFEDQIMEAVADNVAKEMIAEIRDEVAVWIEKLPIISPKVRSTDVTKVFQERFAKQLAERQNQITAQIVLRRTKDFQEIPTGQVRKEVFAREIETISEREDDFLAHVLRCTLLSSKIAIEKDSFEKEDNTIVEKAEREMEVTLRQDREKWMEMGKVSEAEFEKEWDEMIVKG